MELFDNDAGDRVQRPGLLNDLHEDHGGGNDHNGVNIGEHSLDQVPQRNPRPATRAPATAESTMEMLTGSLQRKHPSKNTATIARKVINSILIKIPPWLLWWRDRDSPVPLLYLRLT